MEAFPVIGIVSSLLAAAFFSGLEMAFVSVNKAYVEVQSKKRIFSGVVLSYFLKHPAQFIGTMLVGHIVALVVFGLSVARAWHPMLAGTLPAALALLIEALLGTLLVLIVAEFLPKSLFSINPEKVLSFLAVPLLIIYGLLYIPVAVVVGIARFVITRLFRLDYAEDKPAFRLTDLTQYLENLNKRENEEEASEVEARIFTNALDFKSVRVRDCLVPRTELTAVEVDDPMDKVRKTFVESGHSKVLVYQETIDNVIGYCHALELFKKPKNVTSILSPIMIVPETMLAHELLVRFTTERKSLALVVDEFGGTSGLVSIEDVMEKIFGEIQDEYDVSEDWVEQKLDDHNYILSARQEIDYLNEKYGWNIPEGDYDTLGGLIISINEDLPQMNDIITLPPFTFTILSMQDARIDMVKLTLAEGYDSTD